MQDVPEKEAYAHGYQYVKRVIVSERQAGKAKNGLDPTVPAHEHQKGLDHVQVVSFVLVPAL